MICANCQHQNRENAKFCKACGNKLELTCPRCGSVNDPDAAFCDHCGSQFTRQSEVQSPKSEVQSLTPGPQPPMSYTPRHLAEQILAAQAAMEARESTDGERKT